MVLLVLMLLLVVLVLQMLLMVMVILVLLVELVFKGASHQERQTDSPKMKTPQRLSSDTSRPRHPRHLSQTPQQPVQKISETATSLEAAKATTSGNGTTVWISQIRLVSKTRFPLFSTIRLESFAKEPLGKD